MKIKEKFLTWQIRKLDNLMNRIEQYRWKLSLKLNKSLADQFTDDMFGDM
jgi:hypothetical protein